MSHTINERVAKPFHAYILLLCGCMSVLAAVVIAPILPKMQAHFSDVENVQFMVPLALTAPGLVIAILAMFIGRIADTYGRKKLLVIGLVFYAICGVLPLFLQSLEQIIVSRIGVGITEAVIMTCCTALIGDYYSGIQREKYLALNTTFSSTSAVIFIAVGGALGEFGWRVPFGVYGVSLLLAPLVLLLLWEPIKKTVEQQPITEKAKALWNPKKLALVCFVTLIGGIAFMAIQVHIGYLLEGVGVTSSGTIGMVASGAQVAVVIGSILFRLYIKFGFSAWARLGISFFIIAVGYLIVGSATDQNGVIVGALINGLGCGLLLPTMLCWNMNTLPQHKRAFGTGAWMAAFFLGQFLTPIVVVGISEKVGSMAASIKILGALVLPAAIILLVIAVVQAKKEVTAEVSSLNS